MPQYGRIKYDLFFKRVFSKPHIVMGFLNTVLEKDLKAPIVQVSYEPTDFIVKGESRLLNESKHDVIDVFCRDQEGRHLLIELQKGSNLRALPRFLDYHCRSYSRQFRSGDDYSKVVACYSICWFLTSNRPTRNCLKRSKFAPTHPKPIGSLSGRSRPSIPKTSTGKRSNSK
ncbi:MAG: hypothetical protein HC880_16080 [Bacteroidia bacterium]|nr:hypothetical protein [Bacteroidia bacterium]